MDVHSNPLKILAHSCHSDLHPVLTGSFTMMPEGFMPGSSLQQKTLSFLSHVVKHAQSRLVTVSLSETLLAPEENRPTSQEVRLLIQDDGVGFHFEDEQSGHQGINIMRERASAIQAALSLESEPGHGLRASIIWRKESTSESDHE